MKILLGKYIFVWIPVVLVIVAIPIAAFFLKKEYKTSNTSSTDNIIDSTDEENTDPAGTIVVEAGEGVLEQAADDSLSYVGESARGLEAYLADQGSSVVYNIDAINEGKYTLWVKLSDDAVHESGARSATVVVNNSQTLGYNHYSEDTKGWKWYKIGETSLQDGMNTIVFTKNETTFAAYVMDEFKLVPEE